MPLSNIDMNMEEIGYFLYMEEQEKKVKAIVEEEFYITEEEQKLIESYRKANEETKSAILSIYGMR